MTTSNMLAHATCVSLTGRGVLIRGAPGSGKSDLALRMIDAGGLLVADDQTELTATGGQIIARAPKTISGQMEVRGIGIVSRPSLAAVPVALIVDLAQSPEIERLPEETNDLIMGQQLPVVVLDPAQASAVARIRLALDRIDPLAERSPSGSDKRRVLVVTGPSGSGRSVALKALEDMGYEAIDNLPLSLVPSLFIGDATRPCALGLDMRTRDFNVQRLLETFSALTANQFLSPRLVFIDCDDETLIHRFTETRRRHPLAMDRPLAEGILAERRLLAPIKARADLLFDTSRLSIGNFRRLLSGHLGLASDGGSAMTIFVTSFSYRHGLPREADLVIDVRFLKNPHYRAELRDLTGRDPSVAAYIREDEAFDTFFAGFTDWLAPLLPRYQAEGKSYLTIAIGCTGGKHRSVFTAEALARWLGEAGQSNVVVAHRDVDRQA